MVHQPHGGLGDLGGEFFQLDAVELINIAQNFAFNVQKLRFVLVQNAQNIQFKLAQFAIGDDQKVAAAAGGIKEFQLGQALMKLMSFFRWFLTLSNSARSSSRNNGPMSLRIFFSVV